MALLWFITFAIVGIVIWRLYEHDKQKENKK